MIALGSIEESIKELKGQIAKLDGLIKMGETFIHMIDTAADGHSIDELPSDIQEDYLGILKDIKESQALKKDLEIMLYAAENILNRAAVYEDDKDESDEEVDEDE